MTERHNQLLLDCYLSGQVSERQWQAHLAQDPGLAEYVAGEFPRPHNSTEEAIVSRIKDPHQ